MTRDEVFAKMTEILKEQKGDDFEVKGELPVDEWTNDSVEMMEFVVTLEEDLNVSIPDEAVDSFKTVNDVVDYIVENKGNVR